LCITGVCLGFFAGPFLPDVVVMPWLFLHEKNVAGTAIFRFSREPWLGITPTPLVSPETASYRNDFRAISIASPYIGVMTVCLVCSG